MHLIRLWAWIFASEKCSFIIGVSYCPSTIKDFPTLNRDVLLAGHPYLPFADFRGFFEVFSPVTLKNV